MELSQETLESVGRYVRSNLSSWLRDVTTDRETALLERSVRIEEELKAQRELIQHGFGLMEKRFEQVDKRFEDMRLDMNARFEQVDKRFEEMRFDMNARFEQVDKRFEQVDKRFEQVDKRFEDMRSDMNTRFGQSDERFREMHRFTSRWFTVISVILALLTVSGIVNSFLG